MASTTERIQELVEANLNIEGRKHGDPLDLNASFADAGISSMAALAFMRKVVNEFDVQMSAGECAQFTNLQALIDYLDSNAG